MRERSRGRLRWAVAIWTFVLLGACSPATEPAGARVAQRRAALAVTPGVPEDFPRMLGCAAEELGNPSDPAVVDQLTQICDVVQRGLYELSQDPGLDDQAKMHHALMLMGGGLQRMTEVLVAANGPSPTDAGVQP